MSGPPQSQRGPRNPDPEFPLSRGYICIKSWQPTPQQQQKIRGVIEIQVGDEGCVRDLKGEPGFQWVWLTVPRRNVQGFIPFSNKYINIGNAIYGRFKINFGFRNRFNFILTAGDTDSLQGRFARTVFALLIAFHQKASDIGLPSKFQDKLRDNNARILLAQQIVEGAEKAGALDTLNRTDFSLKQLARCLTPVSLQDRGASIVYLQALKKFPRDTERLPEIRIGKAGDAWRRAWEHRSSIKTGQGKFYVATREAIEEDDNNYEIYSLIRDLPDDEARTISEQIKILMFGTYRDDVTCGNGLRHISIDSSNPSRPNLNTASYNISMDAAILTKLADEVFEQTGWEVATKRDSFGCTVGWNKTSPFFENDFWSEVVYTRLNIPDENATSDRPIKAVFRRTPTTVNNTDKSPTILQISSRHGTEESRKFHFMVGLSNRLKEPRPQQGDQVNTVIEIMLNGQPHEHGYGRLPRLAPWSDWNDAAGVAIKFEWYNHDMKVWTSMYVKSAHRIAGFSIYSKCMAIRRFFLRETLPAFQETWQADLGGVARVKEVTFSNLTQTITLADILTTTRGVLPTVNQIQSLQIAMRAAGARNIGSPATSMHLGGTRTNCDRCYLWPSLIPCVRVQEKHVCVSCHAWGYECSWTPASELRSQNLTQLSPNLTQLLLPPAPAQDAVFEVIEDPQVRSGEL